MSFLDVLPLVIVMVAGPQILSAIFLATSENWRGNAAAFVSGAAVSITLVVTLAYAFGGGAARQGASNTTFGAVILLVLVGAAVHTYRTREQAEPPQWMGRLETATPRFSFRLGFLLLGFFPTNILTSVAVGSYLAANDAPWTDAVPFILLTLFVLALPALTVAAFGDRAERFLPKARDWMNANSWIVNEVVIVFFVGLTVNNLLG